MAFREKNQSGQIFLLCVQHPAGIFLCGTTSSVKKACFPINLVVFEDYTHTHTHKHILQSDRYVYLLTLLSLQNRLLLHYQLITLSYIPHKGYIFIVAVPLYIQ